MPIACKFRDSIPPTVEEFPDTTDNVVARGMLERLPAMCIPVPGAFLKPNFAREEAGARFFDRRQGRGR